MKRVYKDIVTKDFSLAEKLLANRHIREWIDYEASSKQAFYDLRCKHRLEIDRLRFDQIKDRQALKSLIIHHHNEMNNLTKEQEILRLNIENVKKQEKAKTY